MNEPAGRLMVTLTVEELEELVEKSVKKALAGQPRAKLWFNVKEASQMLGWKETTLQERCRLGKIPHRRDGHRYFFSQADLDKIIEAAKHDREEE